MASWRKAGSAALVLMFAAAFAPPPGWSEFAQDAPGVRVFVSRGAPGVSVLLFPVLAVDGARFEQVTRDVEECVDARTIRSDPAVIEIAGQRCAARAVREPDGWRAAVALDSGEAGAAGLLPAVRSFVPDQAPAARPATSSGRPPVAPPVASRPGGVQQSRSAAAAWAPVGAVLRNVTRVIGNPAMVMLTPEPWFLYAGGIANDCVTRDPAELPRTIAALKALKCGAARWRRSGGKIEFERDDGSWEATNFPEARAVPAATIDFDGAATNAASYAVPGGTLGATPTALVTSSQARLRLTRDGRLVSNVVGTQTYNRTSTSETGVSARYRLNGFVIEITSDEGRTVRRPFIFSPRSGPGDRLSGFYLEDRAYLQEHD